MHPPARTMIEITDSDNDDEFSLGDGYPSDIEMVSDDEIGDKLHYYQFIDPDTE